MTRADEAKMRKLNLKLTRQLGFDPADDLPLPSARFGSKGRLRPCEEIVARLMCFRILFMWVFYPEDVIATEKITSYVRANHLNRSFSGLEKRILKTPRTQSADLYGDYVRWKCENMWSLAWMIGFDPHPTPGGELRDDVLDGILALLPGLDVAELVQQAKSFCRNRNEVMILEDFFYCVLNAVVRQKEMGLPALPDQFDRTLDGQRVIERYFALAWALSPEKSWEKVEVLVELA